MDSNLRSDLLPLLRPLARRLRRRLDLHNLGPLAVDLLLHLLNVLLLTLSAVVSIHSHHEGVGYYVEGWRL